MNVYDINGTDWVCANSPEEALSVWKKYMKDDLGENPETYENSIDIKKLTEEQLDTFFFRDDGDKWTFREELARRTKPEFFASTEY